MRRHVKAGELLAIKPDRIHHDANGAWWESGVEVPPNEVRGYVHMVYIRGELEHHDGANSYDAIVSRMEEAFACPDTTSVLLCIDSPGGVVAGLSAATRSIRKMADESVKPLIGYVNEMCASAAYHISTACDELYCPDSAIIGAIGVIATMGDQSAADKKMGLNFVTLTSGARKADGHPHVPISTGAIAAEQARVDRSARAFWATVGQARGLSPGAVKGYEAGIFVGKLAVKASLVDDVLDFDELLGMLGAKKVVAQPVSRVSTSPQPGTSSAKRSQTMLALRSLLKRTKARLAKATEAKDVKAIASLTALVTTTRSALEAYKKVKKTVKYEAESDEGDMDDDEAEESEEAEEEEEEEAEEKGNETDRKEGDVHVHADGDDDEDDDDEEEDEEEEEAEEKVAAKKAKAKAAAARGAVAGLSARLDRIERDTLKRNQSALINEALAARRITRAQAKHLAGETHAFVRSFLKMAKRPLVAVDEDALAQPDGTPHGDVPRATMAQIDLALSTMNLPSAEARTKVRDEMIAEHRKQFARANGAGRF